MKKLLSVVLLFILSVFAVGSVSVYAESGRNPADLSAETLQEDTVPRYVVDEAGLFRTDEIILLEEKAREISGKYPCSIFIIAADDFPECRKKADARKIFDRYGLKYDEERGNLLLLYSVQEKRCLFITSGFGNAFFNDLEKHNLTGKLREFLQNSEFYSGFSSYLHQTEGVMKSIRDEDMQFEPGMIITENPLEPVRPVLFSLLAACVLAGFLIVLAAAVVYTE